MHSKRGYSSSCAATAIITCIGLSPKIRITTYSSHSHSPRELPCTFLWYLSTLTVFLTSILRPNAADILASREPATDPLRSYDF